MLYANETMDLRFMIIARHCDTLSLSCSFCLFLVGNLINNIVEQVRIMKRLEWSACWACDILVNGRLRRAHTRN